MGLGTEFIHDALVKMSSFRDPILKSFFSSLTIASGFKGGEFIPLVFIGSTLGSALGAIMPVSFSLLAALGFAGVFAGAANTPLACAVMASEIFGWNIFFYALITCYVSYYCSSHPGIYRTQKIHQKKNHLLHKLKFIIFKK
jgi:H+/Cl- antiporter ClcA